MKYLTDYTEEAITKILEDNGAFYAFNDNQYDTHKKEGLEYVALGGGLICPKNNARKLVEDIVKAGEVGRAMDISENGRAGVIRRELANHEFSYTLDLCAAWACLEPYGFTQEEVAEEAQKYLADHRAWEAAEEAKEREVCCA